MKIDALFSLGFRPFFLSACLWAGLAMVGWLAALSGVLILPSAFDPASWHAHEMLFGYLSAVFAGFLLTAVPNWTGREPLTGVWLAGLWALWVVGRLVVFGSSYFPSALVLVADLSVMIVLSLYIAREIIAAKNWRNFGVVALLLVFLSGNVLFHLESFDGGYPAAGLGFRLGLGAAILLISLIGGRIVPAFTQNWLRQQGAPVPEPLWPRLDLFVVLASCLVIAAWVVLGLTGLVAWLLLVIGFLHVMRLCRWWGHLVTREPLVSILHVGYGFVPLGAITLGVAGLFPHLMDVVTAQHFWVAGALGVMTLAVMTRASLGHTGQTLQAGRGTSALYGLIVLAVLTRVMGAYAGSWSLTIYLLSATFWCAAFFGFVLMYGPALTRPRRA